MPQPSRKRHPERGSSKGAKSSIKSINPSYSKQMDDLPKTAKPLAGTILILLLVSIIFLLEPWPFSSFRLFSHLRVDAQIAWTSTAINESGEETDYPLGAASSGSQGFIFRLSEFRDATSERQLEICQGWLNLDQALVKENVQELRLYQRRWSVSDRDGDRAKEGEITLIFKCDRDRVVQVGEWS